MPLIGETNSAAGGFDRLIKKHSTALLLAYPGARVFYALVALALVAGVGLHAYELRRRCSDSAIDGV